MNDTVMQLIDLLRRRSTDLELRWGAIESLWTASATFDVGASRLAESSATADTLSEAVAMLTRGITEIDSRRALPAEVIS